MTEATTEVVEQPIEPAVVENALANEPAVEAPPEPEVTPEPEPQPEPVDHGNKGKSPWFLKRISEESEARRVAEQKAADLQGMLERLQAGKEAPATTPAPNSPDFQTAVQREAARLRLAEDSTAIRDAGYREFGTEFGQNLAVLNAAGAVSDDIVLDLIAVDKSNAHKILATLAQDPERASALAAMDSRRRTAELTRISMATNAPPAAPKAAAPAPKVSKAPAPPPPVEPSATKTKDWRSADATEEEFQRGWEESMARRSKGRR